MKLSKTDRKTSNKLVVSTGYACVVAELVNDDEPSLLYIKSFCCKSESDQYFTLLKGKSFDDLSSTISTDFDPLNRMF
ncbi:MAG: hypothetical protein SPE82_06810 [Succinivibrio sp.]|nr:hypothetical protein [Succinivibrio sp.]